MNEHINKNIQHYINLDNPEYALLLSGEWGSGKTYFINNFIKNNKIDKKFIMISLFGLKSTESIDEQIFFNLHPILGSKYTKLLGNILKGAIKIGCSVDFNGDGKQDVNFSKDLKTFPSLDFFSKDKISEKIVLIFDDLERTEISIKEILGYINYMAEIANIKIIIIANEEDLKQKGDVYKDFREKVIGKTLEIQVSFHEILEIFIAENKIGIKNLNLNIIKEIYNIANYNNLRHLKRSVADFKNITDNIEDEFINNDEFLAPFTRCFFALSLEIKQKHLNKKELINYNPLLENTSESNKSDIGKIIKKHNINYYLLSTDIWCKLLYEGYIEKKELNSYIRNLELFKKDERPSWVKLWHYRELENEDFLKNINDVIEKFKHDYYKIPNIYLHIISLLIFFYKKNLSPFSLENIKSKVNDYPSTNFENHPGKHEIGLRNNTGLPYLADEDSDFQTLLNIVKNKYEEALKKQQSLEINDKLELLLGAIKNNDSHYIYNFLFIDNTFNPILTNFDSEKFLNVLLNSSNKTIHEVSYILANRYLKYTRLNGKDISFYLKDELIFLKSLNRYIDSYCESNKDNPTVTLDIMKDFQKTISECQRRLE